MRTGMAGLVLGAILSVSALTTGTSAQAASVEKLYERSCVFCHASGTAGAPKTGDQAAWKERLKKGMDTLVDHAKNGYNAMPPGGMCGQCTDQDFRALIEYMTSTTTTR